MVWFNHADLLLLAPHFPLYKLMWLFFENFEKIWDDFNLVYLVLYKQVVGPFKIWPCEVPYAFLQEWSASNPSITSRSRPGFGFEAHGNVFALYSSKMVVVGNRNLINGSKLTW